MIIDMHVHTNRSKCSGMSFKSLEKAAVKAGLDGVVITDHNTVQGYREAVKVVKRIKLFPGIELKTDQGELILIYPPDGLKKGMELSNAIDRARENDSIVVVPHPFDFFRDGIKSRTSEIKPDAIEVFNARAPFPFINSMAENYAKKHRITAVSGSDAHFPEEVGKTAVEFSGDLRKAIKLGKIKIIRKNYCLPFGHMKTILTKLEII